MYKVLSNYLAKHKQSTKGAKTTCQTSLKYTTSKVKHKKSTNKAQWFELIFNQMKT